MSENAETISEQMAAFQKIWTESMSKLMQTAFGNGHNSVPPEILRQMRAGIFQALAKSWEEFMRSPQFLDGMKQWMDNAINFRKTTNDFMAKVRNELQAPSRDDMDAVLLGIRHMENRLLDRMEELAKEIAELKNPVPGGQSATVAQSRSSGPKAPRRALR